MPWLMLPTLGPGLMLLPGLGSYQGALLSGPGQRWLGTEAATRAYHSVGCGTEDPDAELLSVRQGRGGGLIGQLHLIDATQIDLGWAQVVCFPSMLSLRPL